MELFKSNSAEYYARRGQGVASADANGSGGDELISYTTGVGSDWIQTSITLTTKIIPPTDVASITGFEVGGDVYLSWSSAAGLDLKDYELRWGTTGDTWDTAALLDRIVALRYVSKGVISTVTRRFFVKARDWVGNCSANAAYCDVLVTLDPDALQSEYTPVNPKLTAMVTFLSGP